MGIWKIIFEERTEKHIDFFDVPYRIYCECGEEVSDDNYNSDTHTYHCSDCESESDDIENIYKKYI